MEHEPVKAAISFACALPVAGAIVTGVAKASKAVKAVKTAERVASACKTAAKVGHVAAAVRGAQDTYRQADLMTNNDADKWKYFATSMVFSMAAGAAAKGVANKVGSLVKKNLPKLLPKAKENVKNLFGKVVGRFRKGGKTPDFYVISEGSVIPKAMYHSLSDVDARKWYLSQKAKIPDLIDYSQPLEQQAYQAFSLRNQYRTTARELMANRKLAELLY